MGLPLPFARFEDEPFWTGGADGTLRIARCTACRTWLHPPRPRCRVCRGVVQPEPVTGRGVVHSFTVNRQRWTAALEPPYVLAIVHLDDAPGVGLTTRLVDVDQGTVEIGMRVRVRFVRVEDVWLPLFGPEAR